MAPPATSRTGQAAGAASRLFAESMNHACMGGREPGTRSEHDKDPAATDRVTGRDVIRSRLRSGLEEALWGSPGENLHAPQRREDRN